MDCHYFTPSQEYMEILDVLSLLSTNKQLTKVVLYFEKKKKQCYARWYTVGLFYSWICSRKKNTEGDYGITIECASSDLDRGISNIVSV